MTLSLDNLEFLYFEVKLEGLIEMERTRTSFVSNCLGECASVFAYAHMHNDLTVQVAEKMVLMPFIGTTEIRIKYSKALVWLHGISHNHSQVYYVLNTVTLLLKSVINQNQCLHISNECYHVFCLLQHLINTLVLDPYPYDLLLRQLIFFCPQLI